MYNDDCCSDSNTQYKLAATDNDAFATELANMVQEVWKRKGMPKKIHKSVADTFANELWAGTTKGYGSDIISIAYDTPDYEMLANLQKSVYQFSAAKNYQQLKALTQALVGDDGKLRTFSQFKEVAFEINDTHVNQWLKTEYDTAIASGQMASKWVSIQSTKSSLGMLEFDAVMDARTSTICRPLEGVRKPVDDIFWNTYYPPNHFKCRSTVRQRSGTYQTPTSKINPPEIPDMFKTNLAKSGLVFPDKHPYYDGVPPNIINDYLTQNNL